MTDIIQFFQSANAQLPPSAPVEIVLDVAKVAVLAWLSYLAIRRLGRHFGKQFEKDRRVWLLILLSAALMAIKVCEDVIDGESSVVDQALLVWLHSHTSTSLAYAAGIVTISGSWMTVLPLSVISVALLLAIQRRQEALYLAATVIAGQLLTYVLKLAVGRERPALWDHDWYWGASFPSGHTLMTTCYAMAAAVCVSRLWPQSRLAAFAAAATWVLLVAISRMVLGVHWPTDVAAAVCIGVVIASVLQVMLKRAS